MTKDNTNSQGLIPNNQTYKHDLAVLANLTVYSTKTLLVNLEVNSTQVSSSNCYFKHACVCVCVDTETCIIFCSPEAWYGPFFTIGDYITSRPACNRELGFIDCSCLCTWMSISFSSPQDHTESLSCVLPGECSCVHLSHPLPEGNQHVRDWANTYVEVLCRNRRLIILS